MKRYVLFIFMLLLFSAGCDWTKEVDPQWREFNESTLRVSNQEILFLQAVDLLSHSVTMGDAFSIEQAAFNGEELEITIQYEGGIGLPHFELLYHEEDHLEAGASHLYAILTHYQQKNGGRVMQTQTLKVPLKTSEKRPVSLQIVNGSFPTQRLFLKL